MKLSLVNTIKTVEDWGKYAAPFGGEKQWKDGRSAKELAKYVIDNKDGYKAFNECFNAMGIIPDTLSYTPEYVTRFPANFGSGEGRHHDLAIWYNKNIAFLGVEAKADESFDAKVSDWILSAKSDNAIANRIKRIDAMSKLIMGRNFEVNDKVIGNLRYQLFSALTGVIIEANSIGATKAGLLILTFKKNGKNEKPAWKQSNIDRNNTDLEAFMKEANSYEIDKETWTIALKNCDYSCKEIFVFHKTIE